MFAPIHRCLTASRKLGDRLIEDLPLWVYFVIFIVVVAGLGWLYCFLTPYGQGMEKDSRALSNPTFFQGLYFSISTVTTLGYTDVEPMGFSKGIACAEVLFGLAFIGVVIAKITSRRLSHHVRRLFGADAQKRLEEFTVQFDRLKKQLATNMKDMGSAYQPTPDGTAPSADARNKAMLKFQVAVGDLHSRCVSLANYILTELDQGGYFDIVPVHAVQRLGDSFDSGLFLFAQLIISLTPEARIKALDGERRQRISEAIGSNLKVCQAVERASKAAAVRECFRRALNTCNEVNRNYFSTPIPAPAHDQPDQIVPETTDPEEGSPPGPDMNVTNNDSR